MQQQHINKWYKLKSGGMDLDEYLHKLIKAHHTIKQVIPTKYHESFGYIETTNAIIISETKEP